MNRMCFWRISSVESFVCHHRQQFNNNCTENFITVEYVSMGRSRGPLRIFFLFISKEISTLCRIKFHSAIFAHVERARCEFYGNEFNMQLWSRPRLACQCGSRACSNWKFAMRLNEIESTNLDDKLHGVAAGWWRWLILCDLRTEQRELFMNLSAICGVGFI